MSRTCINCGKLLTPRGQVWLCLTCNSDALDDTLNILDSPLSNDQVFIECPGATIYEPGTETITAGVRFFDENDSTKGYEVIGHQIFAPTHNKRRMIKKEAIGRIRRCQACQDYTVRMRRPEGPDFFIPSPKHPGRKKLKTIEPVIKR
jgi:hypothetical protein